MLCMLISYISGGTYSLKSTPNDRFEKRFKANLFDSQSFCQKSAERKSPKKYFSCFIFDDWPGIRTQAFASNKPTHYLLDYGDLLGRIFSEWFEWFIKIYSLSSCCIYKKKSGKKRTKRVSKANIQPSSEYCSVHMRIILILWFL